VTTNVPESLENEKRARNSSPSNDRFFILSSDVKRLCEHTGLQTQLLAYLLVRNMFTYLSVCTPTYICFLQLDVCYLS